MNGEARRSLTKVFWAVNYTSCTLICSLKIVWYTVVYFVSIRQKRESQNGCFNKTKHVKFYEKRTFFTTCSFFGKFDMLCFLETPASRFALLPYNRRYVVWVVKFMNFFLLCRSFYKVTLLLSSFKN